MLKKADPQKEQNPGIERPQPYVELPLSWTSGGSLKVSSLTLMGGFQRSLFYCHMVSPQRVFPPGRTRDVNTSLNREEGIGDRVGDHYKSFMSVKYFAQTQPSSRIMAPQMCSCARVVYC